MSDYPKPLPDQAAVGWRDRLFGWRAVAATTLAAVILGSAGGMALAAAADGDGSARGGFPGRGQFPGGSQLPGGQTPTDQLTGGQLPGSQPPGSQLPSDQAPTGQVPGGLAGQAGGGQLPSLPQGQVPPGTTGQPDATLPRDNDEEA